MSPWAWARHLYDVRQGSVRQPWTSATGQHALGNAPRRAPAGREPRSCCAGFATGSGPWPAPRVDVAVSCQWAGRAVSRALREAGALPITTNGLPAGAPPTQCGVALVYDLSPWDSTAVELLQNYSARNQGPVLLYLPPTGSAFAALSSIRPDCRFEVQIQSRSEECLEHLARAAHQLVGGVPRVRIMNLMSQSFPRMSSAAYLFGHRALAVLGSGQRPTVGAIARALGFSPRTLQRHFATEGLPGPKALLDWLTLAHIKASSETLEVSPARAAARARLTGNDLYRLRKRVARHRWAMQPVT